MLEADRCHQLMLQRAEYGILEIRVGHAAAVSAGTESAGGPAGGIVAAARAHSTMDTWRGL